MKPKQARCWPPLRRQGCCFRWLMPRRRASLAKATQTAPRSMASSPRSRGAGKHRQVANLVYAHTKSSKRFSDHFLSKGGEAIRRSRRAGGFDAVKLAPDELA